jgi:hypothetical protein
MSNRIERLDRNFAPIETTGETLWYDLHAFEIEGQGWRDVESPYDRFPARAKAYLAAPVWELSQHAAGLAARFVATTSGFSVRWTVRNADGMAMPHMPATGVSGLDLYARLESAENQWRFLANARPGASATTSIALIVGMPVVRREYLLYLPLYNGVASVHLGLPPDAALEPPPPRARKPMVFYGASVTQGGCASRPGMAYPAILGRWLDTPVINLGFSGNARMEMDHARLVAELDASVFVIDCIGLMKPDLVTERTGPFILALREAHPTTPIVMLGSAPWTNRVFLPGNAAHVANNNAAVRAALDRLTASGVQGLTYVPSEPLYGDDGEATVDGGHPNDLGFLRMTQGLEPLLRTLI